MPPAYLKILFNHRQYCPDKTSSHPNISSSVKVPLLLKILNEAVDALQLTWNVNPLRTMLDTLLAVYTMVCLSQFGHRTVVAYEECPTRFAVVRVLRCEWHTSLVDTFVKMQQYSRNVQPIRAGHAIFAIVAGNGGVA